jgi:hypothetical protein
MRSSKRRLICLVHTEHRTLAYSSTCIITILHRSTLIAGIHMMSNILKHIAICVGIDFLSSFRQVQSIIAADDFYTTRIEILEFYCEYFASLLLILISKNHDELYFSRQKLEK